ncbi:MAG: hypothetical protein K2X29_00315 [Candidatus Obscuribacterales bacterium]|nr:hypothetical protein [Candidatus Obscuribacterales bacterium]
MKTKSIFVLLLVFLFGLGANPISATPCSCPVEVTASQAAPAIANTLNDICSDCGHTSNCCFSHKEIPFSGSVSLSQLERQPELPTVSAISFKIENACSTALAASDLNKAPPWRQTQTLVSLHQRLLI